MNKANVIILSLVLTASMVCELKFSYADAIIGEDVGVDSIATTSNFDFDPLSLIPKSATTTFHEPRWSKDQTNDSIGVAEHELLHAIGFTIGYPDFLGHLQAKDQITGSRNFVKNADRTGAVLAIITGSGTHVDPKAGVVNNFDQSKSIMAPEAMRNVRMGVFEKNVLDAAFDWSGKNINIIPKFIGAFDLTEKNFVLKAIDDATVLFNSDKSGAKFVWTVQIDKVPEPSSIIAFAVGFGLLALLKCRFISGRVKSSNSRCKERSRLACRVTLQFVALFFLGSVSAIAEPAKGKGQNYSEMPTSRLISLLESKAGTYRAAASAELLRRGRSALPEFGPEKPDSFLVAHPSRIEVIRHLIKGLEPGNYLKDSFGLYVERKIDRQEIISMGKRRGFVLEEKQAFGFDHAPNCYVVLEPGRDLATVLQDVLAGEPDVISVSLNLFEN